MYMILLALLLPAAGRAQEVLRGTDWRIYNLQGNALFTKPVDSLAGLSSYSPDKDSLMLFMAQAKKITVNGNPAWMGGYLASCRVEGKLRKVLISFYGGFFYDPEAGKYYELPEGMVRDWNGFLTRAYFKIPQ